MDRRAICGATGNFDFSQSSTAIELSGVLGGIAGGYNWQNGPIVIGLEGDVLGAGISGSGRFNNGANVANPDIDAMANLRLRAGLTVVPQVMLFVTGGGAWADVDLPVSGPGGGSGNRSFFGWSVGLQKVSGLSDTALPSGTGARLGAAPGSVRKESAGNGDTP